MKKGAVYWFSVGWMENLRGLLCNGGEKLKDAEIKLAIWFAKTKSIT